jgi:hypothetical protein
VLVRRPVVLLTVTALAAATVPVALAASSGSHGPKPATYLVGGGVRDINPSADMLAGGQFHLGGYGFADGKVGNQVAVPGLTDSLERSADGILGDGAHSRAFAVSDSAATIVLAQIETQGYFAAYRQGPFGITEIRKDASAKIAAAAAAEKAAQAGTKGRKPAIAPVPTASQIVVDSDHSHGGPDTVGVWGGVPTSYLKYVHDQTVDAIVDAWKHLRPATLTSGAVHGGVAGEAAYTPKDGDWLIHNQFSNDPNNQTMDDEVRVLQARDPDTGDVIDTYVNFSAHPTVLGSDNTKVTGDYVGRLDDQLEAAFGGFAMDQVGTLGRTQPERAGCDSMPGVGDGNPVEALCALDSYAARVVKKVKEALAVASPLTGKPKVALNSYLLTDPATNPVLVGVIYAGSAIGAQAGRAPNAPWFTGSLIGTTYFSGRIGDILISGGPGEMYPQIVQKVRDTVTGMRGYMSIGTAGDFLGYIIAPLEAYPCPAEASVVSGTCNLSTDTDPTSVGPDPIGNDNYFFNVSHTFGERLTCDLLRGAGDIVAGDPMKYWSTYSRCAAFATDLELPPGADTLAPEQPDLSALQPHM